MSSADRDTLIAIADQLYGLPASEFTSARDRAAKDAGDRALADRIKALRKPTTAAWGLNLLVRREGDRIDQVLELADGLRRAAEALDGDELRELTRQRRQLTAALTTAARRLMVADGVRCSDAVADQIEASLTGALLDPVAAQVLRAGLTVAAFTATGVGDALEAAAVCAVPDALGHRAAPTGPIPPAEPAAPALRLVSDLAVRLDAARERVHHATLARAVAEEEAEHLDARLQRLRARQLQLGGELDELRRRISEAEDALDAVDEEIEEIEAAAREAAADVGEAAAELDAAEAALEELEGAAGS